jgi:hypothetical protein
MSSSYFFGPAHDIKTVTLPPRTGRTASSVLPTFLHTPLGGGSVVVKVHTDRTGSEVVGRCDYQLHLSAPPGVKTGTPLRPVTRWLFQVPVRICAIEGSDGAGDARPGQLVAAGRMLDTLAEANETIWYPQAQVAFSTPTDRIPVIEDPTPPNGANGALGDLDLYLRVDGEVAADVCTQAWERHYPGRRGIPIVNARAFFQDAVSLGFATGPQTALYVAGPKPGTGMRGDALCGSPVALAPSDIGKQVAILPDKSWPMQNAPRLLAHELGHTLFLGHGNGLDDDGDGRRAGFAGSRRYDEYCDPGWLTSDSKVVEDVGSPTPCSLMQRFACTSMLRPLQVETARGVARFMPGMLDGTPAPRLVIASSSPSR